MKKEKLTAEESRKGIRAYASYVRKRNRKYLNGLRVIYEEIKV
jgi:hypothetical protein